MAELKSKAAKLAEEVDRHLRPELYYKGFAAREPDPLARARLEQAVVEAAKEWRKKGLIIGKQLGIAVDRLLQFEQEQK